LRIDVERGCAEVDFGIGIVKVEARRKLPVLERENRLDNAGDTRCCVKMTNIGFYRANGAIR
jgi:hypothetical protein